MHFIFLLTLKVIREKLKTCPSIKRALNPKRDALWDLHSCILG